MTLEALKMVVTGDPTLSPRRSKLALVMMALICTPSPASTTTSAFTAEPSGKAGYEDIEEAEYDIEEGEQKRRQAP